MVRVKTYKDLWWAERKAHQWLGVSVSHYLRRKLHPAPLYSFVAILNTGEPDSLLVSSSGRRIQAMISSMDNLTVPQKMYLRLIALKYPTSHADYLDFEIIGWEQIEEIEKIVSEMPTRREIRALTRKCDLSLKDALQNFLTENHPSELTICSWKFKPQWEREKRYWYVVKPRLGAIIGYEDDLISFKTTADSLKSAVGDKYYTSNIQHLLSQL